MQRVKVDVPAATVVKVVLTLLLLYGLWQIRIVVVIVFVSLILVAALGPTVEWLEQRGLPSMAASGVTVFGLAVILGEGLFLLATPLMEQVQGFVQEQLPRLMEQASTWLERQSRDGNQVFNVQRLVRIGVEQLQAFATHSLTYISSVLSVFASLGAIVFITFYTLADRKSLLRRFFRLVPAEHRPAVADGLRLVGERLGYWLRGQFVLSVVMGLLVSLSAWLIGIPWWAAVGIAAAVFEIIPYLGPLITAVIMVLMASTAETAPLVKILLSLGVYGLLQFVEGHLLVPKIMEHAVGISPVLVLLALLVGAELGHVIGILLAIPAVAVIEAVIEAWPSDDLARPT